MKKHAIIPIFIPHKGCPNDCVFCNQKKITAHQKEVTAKDVETTVETWLSTLESRGLDTIETAFFGGSFTGISLEEQTVYLRTVKKFKDAGRIDKIHLSTRPDYIDKEILDNLKKYDVDTIELGVQSFDDQVLSLSGRGHDSSCVYRAAELIKEWEFELGIQLMIGLPGDSLETCIYSAEETVKIGPSIARLYPTVVIRDTELYSQYLRGDYVPLPESEAVMRTKKMYRILTAAGINIIRVGLKSSDIISERGEIGSGTFHPAFRQLVEGELAKEQLVALLDGMNIHPVTSGSMSDSEVCIQSGRPKHPVQAEFFSNRKSFSNMVGHQKKNKKFFLEMYPQLNILYKVNDNLSDNQFEIKIKGEEQ